MKSARNTRILYFTIAPLGQSSGGSIVCREHIKQLASDSRHDLTVCTFDHDIHAKAFVNSLGAEHYSMTGGEDFLSYINRFFVQWSPCKLWPFPWENVRSGKIDIEFRKLAKTLAPDIIVIDYLFSAVVVPSIYFGKTRILTITLNQEAEFFRQQCRLQKPTANIFCSIFAQWRLTRFEQAVYQNSDAIVTLSANDLPSTLGTDIEATAIQPVLDESSNRWRYRDAAELFYVGSLAHYPNFLAVQWLAEKFAPLLEKYAPKSRINIIGPSAEEVESDWKRKNINYLGSCAMETVVKLFTECGLFIVPIENNFGSKLKVLECISHGTPLIATEGALSGVPFSDRIPQFNLASPEAAVKRTLELMASKQQLVELSEEIRRESRLMLKRNEDQWSSLISQLCENPARPRSKPGLGSPLYQWLRPFDTLQSWPKRLEVCTKNSIGLDVTGMYPIETLADKRSVRWTRTESKIRAKLNQSTLPKRIRLKLLGIRYLEGAQLLLKANNIEIIRYSMARREKEIYADLPNLNGAEKLLISLETAEHKIPGDDRKLGILIESITLER